MQIIVDASLRKRLRNWGEWLNFEAEIGPAPDRCRSLESRCIPDTGEVWDEVVELHIVPDVTDAEVMERLIRQLGCAERWALAMRYGGAGAVMRWRRMGEHALERLADNAEITLMDFLRKSA